MFTKRFFIIFCSIALLSMGLAVQAKPASAIPRIQTFNTYNGAKVFFVERKQLPMLDILTLFNAGSSEDNNLPGLANFTNSMLNEGTQNLSADQIASNFDDVGAELKLFTSRDMAGVMLRSLTDKAYLTPALNTYQQILTQANFPETALLRVKNQLLTQLAAQAQNPQALAAKDFYALLYQNTPYAHDVLGEASALNQITATDLANFYHQYYVAHNAMIIMVGAVNLKQAKQIANTITENMPTGEAAKPLAVIAKTLKPLQENIAFPAAQTQIILGQVGIRYQNPQFFALKVGNYILGGGMLVSRLFQEIRAQHGLAYSVYSYFSPLKLRGPFIISMQTQNDQAPKALAMSQAILKQFIEQGPTKAELTAAKQALIGEFPLNIASNSDILSMVAQIAFYHLPLNYLQTYQQNIEKVSLAEVKRAFQTTLNPNQMVVLTLGK